MVTDGEIPLVVPLNKTAKNANALANKNVTTINNCHCIERNPA
jgi:hypothetical protein